MDFELKLKALQRLSKSETKEAAEALQKESEKASAGLCSESSYEHLAQHLQVLDVIGYRISRATVQTMLDFVKRIETIEITYPNQSLTITDEGNNYYSAQNLIVRAIDVLVGLRYLETPLVLQGLLELGLHKSANVRDKALEALKALARYDINVFFGGTTQAGIGASPQIQIIDHISALNNTEVKTHFSALLTLAENLLSPTMEGTSWSYKALNISSRPIPGVPLVADIRNRTIDLLFRIYEVVTSAPQRLSVIRVLNEATRTHRIGKTDADRKGIAIRDSLKVLDFYKRLVPTEALPIVQKIESNSYWTFHHTGYAEVETAALEVEGTLLRHHEYQIYKTLIGFEGIFRDWAVEKRSESNFEEVDIYRKAKALEYASSITLSNYEEWRTRILKYAETESDDLATFPIFYEFLSSFARIQPELALRMLCSDSEKISRFLIPLLRSLWAGPKRKEIMTLVESWIAEGRYLYQSAKQFLDNENVDVNFLSLILRRADELDELATICEIMSVAVSNYSHSAALIEKFFLPSLEILTKRRNVSWIFDFWFRRETRAVLKNLDEQGIDLILRNLLEAKRIDYHAEEILFLIAQKNPTKVLEFFCWRLRSNYGNDEVAVGAFDALPYEFHKLDKPLSKIPGEAVQMVSEQYDGNYSMFIYGGARLLKSIFPTLPREFEEELLKRVRTKDHRNIEIVLAVLRNYEGASIIHEICREIVRAIPIDSRYRMEVAVALESTGVVMGEFGFAEAFESKKAEMESWLNDPNEKVQAFARDFIADMEKMSFSERMRATEQITLRKHRYGEEGE